MTLEKADPWWKQDWTCPVCHTPVRIHHKSRHMQSAGHKARVNAYTILPSDVDFSEFLEKLKPLDLSYEERHIYNMVKK